MGKDIEDMELIATDESVSAAAEIDIMKLITTDEYANMGGRYIIDPATGKRKPVVEEDEKSTVKDQPLIDNEEN